MKNTKTLRVILADKGLINEDYQFNDKGISHHVTTEVILYHVENSPSYLQEQISSSLIKLSNDKNAILKYMKWLATTVSELKNYQDMN